VIDFLLGLYFAGLFIRGWVRGFAKELMDLVGLIVGLALAFRLSGPLGALIQETFGTSDLVSKLIGGIVVFLLLGVAAAVVAHFLQKFFTLPGLVMSNRLLGGALASLWAVFVAMLVLSLLVVLPLPSSFGDHLEESNVARYLTNPDTPAQTVFHAVAGDKVLEALLNLKDLVGREELILEEGQTLEIPAAKEGELSDDAKAAAQIFDLVNRARLDGGLDPLAWSDPLAGIAQAYAYEMYEGGFFGHESEVTGTVADRIEAAGIPYRVVGENLALAATAKSAHAGLMDSPGHRANILREGFTKVGIGVVNGPLGLMVVEVFQG